MVGGVRRGKAPSTQIGRAAVQDVGVGVNPQRGCNAVVQDDARHVQGAVGLGEDADAINADVETAVLLACPRWSRGRGGRQVERASAQQVSADVVGEVAEAKLVGHNHRTTDLGDEARDAAGLACEKIVQEQIGPRQDVQPPRRVVADVDLVEGVVTGIQRERAAVAAEGAESRIADASDKGDRAGAADLVDGTDAQNVGGETGGIESRKIEGAVVGDEAADRATAAVVADLQRSRVGVAAAVRLRAGDGGGARLEDGAAAVGVVTGKNQRAAAALPKRPCATDGIAQGERGATDVEEVAAKERHEADNHVCATVVDNLAAIGDGDLLVQRQSQVEELHRPGAADADGPARIAQPR